MRPILAAGLAVVLTACSTVAEPAENRPEPALELTGRVVDAADIFSPEFEGELTEKLAQLEKDTLVQLVVASTPDLKGMPIEAYSLELGNVWGVGDEDRDDGLLLLVAPNERQVRIEVGYGLEQAVKDEEASLIIQESVLPEFRNENYETGVDAGVDRLIFEVTSQDLKEAA